MLLRRVSFFKINDKEVVFSLPQLGTLARRAVENAVLLRIFFERGTLLVIAFWAYLP
jgi:hypothetical protein